MKGFMMCSAVLAGSLLAVNAQAQPPAGAQNQNRSAGGTVQGSVQGTGTQIRGEVIRSGDGQFVVRGSDKKEWTFHTNPQTRYWHNSKAGRFEDIRVGATVNAWYGPPEGTTYYVNTVDVIPVEGATTTQVPAPAAKDQFYEGQVVRVVGSDQVVIRTSDNKEITVYVNPQTTYRFNDQPAAFTQLQPGVPIRVDYYMQGDRAHARGIIGRRVR